MKIIVDADLASVFAKVDKIGILQCLFGEAEVGITPEIYEELLVPLDYGYTFPLKVLAAFKVLRPTTEEREEYERLLRTEPRLGKGELEAIAICSNRGYGFAVIDRAARSYAQDKGIHVISLHVTLRLLWEEDILTREEVRDLIHDIERVDRTTIADHEAILD